MSHPGDPTPKSPREVHGDSTYTVVTQEEQFTITGAGPISPSVFPTRVRVVLVVFHRGTETYWQTIYDSSAFATPAIWHRMAPVQEIRQGWKPWSN